MLAPKPLTPGVLIDLGARRAAGAPAVVRHALHAGLVRELRQAQVAGDDAAVLRRLTGQRGVARRRDEADRAVLRDRHVRRVRRDVDVRRRGARAGGRGVHAGHVVAVLRDEHALVVAREVARAGVVDARRGGRVRRRVGEARDRVRDAEPALALDRDVEGVAGGLEAAGAHHVVDRAQAHAEADLRRVGAARAGGRRGARTDRLGEGVAERRASALVADGVDVGEVVRRDVEQHLVRLEAGDGRVHAAHHLRITPSWGCGRTRPCDPEPLFGGWGEPRP